MSVEETLCRFCGVEIRLKSLKRSGPTWVRVKPPAMKPFVVCEHSLPQGNGYHEPLAKEGLSP